MVLLKVLAGGAAMVVVLAASVSTNASELITNGGFESGDFTGWTVFDQPGGSGTFFIDDVDGTTPLSGQLTNGPAAGIFYAVSDQLGPGAHALIQAFTVPAGATSVVLSYDFFVNDFGGGPIVDPAGLDFTASENQHARIDVLVAGADPLSTMATDIVTNLFLGSDDAGPNAYTNAMVDLTALLSPGTTYQLRFAEVDNQNFLNLGVDNVSIDVTAAPVPASMALFGFGLLGLGLVRRGSRA